MNTGLEVTEGKSFSLHDGRLMLSLGPLSEKKYCTYSCPFCYLHSPNFQSYPSLQISEILDAVKNIVDPFDIIYISGDTDSFAKPRTDDGIKLLYELTSLDIDILFTTRAVFDDQQLSRISEIKDIQKKKDKLFIACTSISQINHPDLEPKPIASAWERAQQIKNFFELELISVLALRPFLPIIPVSDYLSIIDSVKENVNVILGSDWYADTFLETKVSKAYPVGRTSFTNEKMDFDENGAIWKVYKSPEVKNAVSAYCKELNIPFFMRSREAIKHLRTQKTLANFTNKQNSNCGQ